MSTQNITTVRFNNYWDLLQLMAPCVDMVIVFNSDGNFIWQSSSQLHPMMERITSHVVRFQLGIKSRDNYSSHMDLSETHELELMYLSNPDIEPTLTLAFISRQVDIPAERNKNTVESIQLLNQTLLNEYALIHKIIEKEQELNAITDELTHRYEELNLIYSSDDHVQNISHGREILKKIVINASNFLDVDLSLIMLPDKNVTILHSPKDQPSRNYNNLLASLKKEIFLQLKIHKNSFVINRFEDAQSLNVLIDLPFKIVVAPMINSENEVIGLMAIQNSNNHIDFTNSDRNLLEVLTNKATNIVLQNFDPLTGLENNHSFELIVLDTLKQAWQNDSHHAIVNIDIDRMAIINDLGGLEAGDKLLKKLASLLTDMVRSYDTVARLSGDKFSILLKNCDLQKAQRIMKKIDSAVNQIEINLDNDVHEVSISIGIAPITADVQTVSSILGNAESALLAAKERGRNQIQVFKLDDNDLIRRKQQIKWVSRTQAALRQNRFELHAQLIHPLSSERSRPHYEILIRMLGSDNDIITPFHFLPAAEQFFLMPKLDRWVIVNTFNTIYQHYRETGSYSFEVSINLSGQSLTDPGMNAFIADLIKELKIDPSILCFEVTETSAVANLDEAQQFIKYIKDLGCKFSLDDFGTGHSSFSYLKNMSVDYLKIDGSFVKQITDDSVSHSMVSAINQIGHAMGIQTIAEYVENKQIQDELIAIGVDFGQGYSIAKPRPLQEVLSELQPQTQIEKLYS